VCENIKITSSSFERDTTSTMTTKKNVDLSATVGGISLSTCVYNASGPRTGTSAAMSKIASSKSGGVLAKSATILSQKGNPLPRTWHEGKHELASLNSEGLPNAGIDYYIDAATISDTMGDHASTKPYMVSVSGKTVDDNLDMIQRVADAVSNKGVNIAAVELNLACPNIIGKPIIAYDFEQLEEVLEKICALPCFASSPSSPPSLVLGVKMPPYFDGPHFERAAAALNKYASTIGYAACINTIGNALAIDPVSESPVISSKGGFAGLSGPAVKYTALANVRKMRELLDSSIDVVGVGGVASGTDAFEMILCGAAAVQVGTCHWTEGPGCFDRIVEELGDILVEKGYKSVKECQGGLKPWSKEGAAVSRKAKAEAKKKEEGGGTKVATKSTSGVDLQSMLSAVLMVIIAFLLFDKFNA